MNLESSPQGNTCKYTHVEYEYQIIRKLILKQISVTIRKCNAETFPRKLESRRVIHYAYLGCEMDKMRFTETAQIV